MKQITLIALVAAGLCFSATVASGQKIAHINSSELLQMMPEVKGANKELEAFSKQLQDQMTSMTAEYSKKYDELEKNAASMQDAIRDLKQKELQQLQERIETFKSSAQESLQKKEQALLEPIVKKAKDAVQVVAKELGYAYVVDTSTGAMIMVPEGDNLMVPVKKKLGITGGEEKPSTPPANQGGSKPAPAKK